MSAIRDEWGGSWGGGHGDRPLDKQSVAFYEDGHRQSIKQSIREGNYACIYRKDLQFIRNLQKIQIIKISAVSLIAFGLLAANNELTNWLFKDFTKSLSVGISMGFQRCLIPFLTSFLFVPIIKREFQVHGFCIKAELVARSSKT